MLVGLVGLVAAVAGPVVEWSADAELLVVAVVELFVVAGPDAADAANEVVD